MVKIGASKLLSTPIAATKDAWKKGGWSGVKSGMITGLPLALGVHPFLSYSVGAVVGGAMTKNPVDKRAVVMLNSYNAVLSLFAGNEK